MSGSRLGQAFCFQINVASLKWVDLGRWALYSDIAWLIMPRKETERLIADEKDWWGKC